MKKFQFNVAVATASKPALRIAETFTLMCVQNATLSTPASKKCWIRLVELINSVKNTACHHNKILNKVSLKNAHKGRFLFTWTHKIAPGRMNLGTG